MTGEVRQFLDQGYTQVKIQIGGRPLAEDLRRIEAVLALLPAGERLAVDAMNRFTPATAVQAARALAPYRLAWFEDVCDPLDFDTQALVARIYQPPLAAGEALFSLADARNLIRYGGLRPDRDVLVFDPVHCYGLPEYLRIISRLEAHGWSRAAIRPHGGHLFCLHLAAALGLGAAKQTRIISSHSAGSRSAPWLKMGAPSRPRRPISVSRHARRSVSFFVHWAPAPNKGGR